MWVILGFMLITTALVPVVGRLADMFGRKNLYNAGFAVFTLGSLLCGFSSAQFHGWDLVLYRMIQGVGGALLFTMSSVVPEKRGTAAGINYMLMSTGQMLSIAIVFPLVLSRIPEEIMFHIFLYGGGMSGAPLAAFESGMHQAFLASFLVTLVAALISALRPRQMSLVGEGSRVPL